jgi:tetratricopeptide (TPR) repeat protein
MRGRMAVRGDAPRRWCLPPVVLRDPADTLEGDSILAESPGTLGLLLWCTARDVTLWASTPADARVGLFAHGSADARLAVLGAAELPPVVGAAVFTLHGMLALSSNADEELVSLGCLEVAKWASRERRNHTAAAFAQAAALAAPDFGDPALQAGTYMRLAGQGSRAETWLRRAVSVSRRETEPTACAPALVELGVLYEGRGNMERAERLYTEASRAARRYADRDARMRAAHGRFRLARRRGDDKTAWLSALIAQAAYEAEATGGSDLLLDLARFWVDKGEPEFAADAFRRLAPSLPELPRPGKLSALALTARVRAENGNPKIAASAAAAAWALMSDVGIAECVRYTAALDLAHAARRTGDLVEFTRAKRSVLLLAPQAEFPTVAAGMAAMWPEGDDAPTLERAS